MSLSHHGSVTYRTPVPFLWEYVSQISGGEAWAIGPDLVTSLDQPRTVNNERIRLVGPGLVLYAKDTTGDISVTVTAATSTKPEALTPQSYAIKNLLLGGTDPTTLTVTAKFKDGAILSGTMNMSFNLRFVVPFLPDPYTANFAPFPAQRPERGVDIGTFRTVVRWQPQQKPVVDVSISLGSGTASTANQAFRTDAILERSVPLLLDVSTNVSQFGVALSLNSEDRTTSSASPLSIADLMLQAPGFAVDVVTLPAVQWEPVATPVPSVLADGHTPYPSPLSYPNSGQMTGFVTDSVTLVPVSLREAIDHLVSSYNASPSSRVEVSFTLPFGISARAILEQTGIITIEPPGFTQVQPNFLDSNLTGGDQLCITGQTSCLGIIGKERPSPFFPGTTTQLRNALAAGASTQVTVLTSGGGDFTDLFNTQFKSSVPLTRMDISGFGQSMFSDWRDVQDSGTHVSKVQFEVMVGRAAREVVQIVSVLYPFTVRVVRTITIERTNGGGIVRHDSGWQAASNGTYQFPQAGIITHPGVIKGATNVTNIRDLSQEIQVASGTIILSAVTFDCDVAMENATLGQTASGVPAKNLTGYVQISFGTGLTASQYAELLSTVGVLGGAIDCIIGIGGSGQNMRVSHIGVASSLNTTGPEFAMAAWGTPTFPTGGQWSFVVTTSLSTSPGTIPRGTGVPLVRAGPAPLAPLASNPFRFVEPADLLPARPSTLYGLVFAMETARACFLQPQISVSIPWAITGTVKPLLADPYAMGTSTGPFPQLSRCIPFNDALYQILISPNGDLRLRLSPTTNATSFTAAVVRRVLLESETARSVACTSDEQNPPTPSQITIVIDSTARPAWSLEITNISLICEVPSMAEDPNDPASAEVTQTVGNMASQEGSITNYKEVRNVWGHALKPVKDALAFFEKFGYTPPMKVSMTNEWGMDQKTTVKLKDFLAAIPGPIGAFLEKWIDDLDFDFLMHADPSIAYMEMEMELSIQLPMGAWNVIFLMRFNYHVGTDGKSYLLTAGAGLSADIDFGPKSPDEESMFEAQASIVATILGLIADHSWGVGMGVIIKASVNLVIVEVEASFEARHMWMTTTCGAGVTKWGLTQVQVAIDIHIFLVLDISFHDNMEWKANNNGGPCAMDVAGLTENAGKPS